MIRAYVAKRYLNLKATVDVQITALFFNWLQTVPTVKQMKDLRFKYEIAL